MENNDLQEQSIKDLFQKYLKPEENIIWTGRPVSKYFLTPLDYIIPFAAIIFCCIVLFPMRWVFNFQNQQDPLIFKLFPLLILFAFIFPVLSFVVKRPLKRYKKLKRICYAITDKRILELSSNSKAIKESDISSLGEIKATIGANGYGTVLFGSSGIVYTAIISELCDLKIGDEANFKKILWLINIPEAQYVSDTIKNLSVKPLDNQQLNLSTPDKAAEEMNAINKDSMDISEKSLDTNQFNFSAPGNIMEESMEIKDLFKKYLKSEESVIWAGKPINKIGLTPYDFINPIATIIILGVFLYAIFDLFNFRNQQILSPLFFSILFILSFSIVIVLELKRSKILKQMRYAITNKRLLELSCSSDTLKESNISSLSAINAKFSRNGYGTIAFGYHRVDPLEYFSVLYGRKGKSNKVLSFFNIAGSQYVCDTIKNLSGKTFDVKPLIYSASVEEDMDLNEDPVQPAKEETSFPQSITPRRVPISLSIMLLFGHVISQFGWLIFGIGLAIFISAAMNADFSELQFRKGYTTAQGMIMNIEGTDEQNLLKYYFTFTDSKGVKINSESYKYDGMALKNGQNVVIEYLQGNSSIARISGTQRKPNKMSGLLLAAVFPLIGLIPIVCFLFSGIKRIGLLKNGTLAPAELKSITKNTSRYSFDLVFEYTSIYGTKHTIEEVTEFPDELRDQKLEPLIYNPSKPNIAVLLDTLPGCPRIDNNGTIIMKDSEIKTDSIKAFLLPIFVILGECCYIYIRFIR